MKINIKEDQIKVDSVKTSLKKLSRVRFISKLLADLNKNPSPSKKYRVIG